MSETTPPAAPSSTKRVLVAEDEAIIRLDLAEMLGEAGYEVVGQAGDGEQAVAMALDLKPDIVIMDVKMPVMDGITAAEQIGKERICPVVMLTAFSQTELVERARDAGVMAYVVKPFTPADLIPALEIALSRHEEIKALESEVTDLQEQFATRKLVERAKSLLTTKMGLTEPEAFRWIQRASMDQRRSMRSLAQDVVDKVDLDSIAARERVTRHDVKARIEEFCALAGHEHIHKGMTSRDLTENVEQLQVRQSLELLRDRAVAALLDKDGRNIESLSRPLPLWRLLALIAGGGAAVVACLGLLGALALRGGGTANSTSTDERTRP